MNIDTNWELSLHPKIKHQVHQRSVLSYLLCLQGMEADILDPKDITMHARSKIEKMAQGNSQSAPHGRIRGGGGGGGGEVEDFFCPHRLVKSC